MSAEVCRVAAVALRGIEGTGVMVEAAVSNQLPGMAIIGLPDTALAEAKQRVRVATQRTGATLSDRFIVVNLSPAALPKQGSSFDLAIALAALAASAQLPTARLAETVHLGELSLDGELRRAPGLLSSVLAARELGFRRVMVPAAGAREAALVPGIEVIAAPHLRDALAWHRAQPGGWWVVDPTEETRGDEHPAEFGPDFADVIGQPDAVEAMVIAAAGRHHVSMTGPPGAGKTLLATCLPSILPDLTPAESLVVSSIASLGGTGISRLMHRPPFESPHHSASMVAMVGGGGGGLIRPGAITRSCHGVLFLDEAPEFPRTVLDALRQPLESGQIEIHRARVHAKLPARMQLVLAANPCPCGQADAVDPVDACRCPPSARLRYAARLSGPLTDRIDVRLMVRRVPGVLFRVSEEAAQPTSAQLRSRVAAARAAMGERLRGTPWTVNSEVPSGWLRGPAGRLDAHATVVLDQALARGYLSARGYLRVLRLAWTVADLAGRDRPGRDEIGHALALRGGTG